MKSNVCELSQNTAELSVILEETEKVAAYTELDKKQTSRLRLLAEELIGMIPELLEYGSGKFWIENEGKNFSLHVSVTPSGFVDAEKRKELLAVSTSGKNAAAVGIMNKIRIAAQLMLIDYAEVATATPTVHEFYESGMTTIPLFIDNSWSLEVYRKAMKQKEKKEAWDELEKSIIANIADDVLVGIQGKQIDIIVKKSF